jgi:hypothetical protein
MRVYISGPITGVPDHAVKFKAAFVALVKQGHIPVNPVTLGEALKYKLGREPTWHEYMKDDIKALTDCDGILMLDGWENSSGARLEEHVAYRLGIKQITLERSNNGSKESL